MNAKIIKIESILVDLPTIRPHHLSMTVMMKQSMVIIKIYSDDGILGIGESTTIGGLSYGPESPEGIKLTIDQYISPVLVNQDASNVNQLMHRIHQNVKGNPFAKAGIETALLDGLGKRLNVSVSELLGGSIRSKVDVLWTLASGNTEQDIEEAKQLIAQNRHRTFKLKIGKKEPKVDVAHVNAIKKALGDDIKITVDINQAWEESTAKNWIHVLQENGIDLVEQPLIKENFEGLSRLTEYFHVPIMADESCASTYDALRLSKIRGGSVFAIKLMKAGSLYAAKSVAAIADAADISVYGGTMLEGTIGTAASAHVFSSLPNLSWGTELFGPLLLTDDIVRKPLTYTDCGLEIPTGSGLGIELDDDKLEHYRRKD